MFVLKTHIFKHCNGGEKVFLCAFLYYMFSYVPLICLATSRNNTLVLVHVLFRHGDRTPNNNTRNMYPNDPYLHDDFYPYGRAQLTDEGKLRSFNMGKELRTRYNDFLGPVWTHDILFAQTTDIIRTKMSLELVLASLFPPTRPKWLMKMRWQPIPYFNVPLTSDKVLFSVACPNYKKFEQQYQQSLAFVPLSKKLPEFNDYIFKHAGGNYTTSSDVSALYSILLQGEECGRKLPEWANAVYPEPMRSVAVQMFEEMNATPELKRLMTGGFLRKVINDTVLTISGSSPQKRKMFLYSAHDINVAGLLINLGIYTPHYPPYACYILIEVHQIANVHGIKLFYQDYTEKEPRPLTLPGCNHFCPLDKFSELVSEGVIKDDDCSSDIPSISARDEP